MWTGCIFFLLLFLAAFGVEWFLLPQAAEPYRWQFSLALAFLVTLALSNLWGLLHALGRLRLVSRDPSRWQDGERVAVSGEIRPLRHSLKAPASGRDVVVYEFQVLRPDYNAKNTRTQHGELTSYGMAPCGIYTGASMVRLIGFPKLTAFPPQSFTSDAHRQRVAPYIASRHWVRRGRSIGDAIDHLQGIYNSPTESMEEHFARPDGVLAIPTLADHGAPAATQRQPVDASLADRILAELVSRAIWMRELVIEAGSTVTAFGVYRANLMAVEVSAPLHDVDRGVYPGAAGRVIGGLAAKALLTLLVMLAITGGAHYAALANDGELLRRFTAFLETS
jgi:hypothetical protein